MKYNFLEVCTDVTKTATKIPQRNYLPNGLFPIYDQGKEKIGGYCNDAVGLSCEFPYIVFGDHTRIIKYVDNRCFIGADGVKLLKVTNKKFIPKYVYYSMLSNEIENQGYSRHFKFLKETFIRYVNEAEQNKIIIELDKINNLLKIKNDELNDLSGLVKSRFICQEDYNLCN